MNLCRPALGVQVFLRHSVDVAVQWCHGYLWWLYDLHVMDSVANCDRALSVAAPWAWNRLPNRSQTVCVSQNFCELLGESSRGYRVPAHLENSWNFTLDLEFLIWWVDLRWLWYCDGCITYKLIRVRKEWMVNVSDECLVFYIFRLWIMTGRTWKILKLNWKSPGFFSSKESEYWEKYHRFWSFPNFLKTHCGISRDKPVC